MDKIFADGLMFQAPSEKAPDFIIGNLSVNVKKFTEFMEAQQNERGWLNLSIKKSKGGNLYVELNTWKKENE